MNPFQTHAHLKQKGNKDGSQKTRFQRFVMQKERKIVTALMIRNSAAHFGMISLWSREDKEEPLFVGHHSCWSPFSRKLFFLVFEENSKDFFSFTDCYIIPKRFKTSSFYNL